ncbi:MAG: protein kinase [Planctomycetes bacterium]|nr:protein kinase [Planctomycetota bacterium]
MRAPVKTLPETLKQGSEFGDFRLIRELGRGGMAIVFEAEELSLQRRVALKIFHPRFDTNLVDSQRFRREAEAGSQLQHPAVVRVFHRGVQDGVPYIASELVADCRNMDQLCEDWKRDPKSKPDEHVRVVAKWFAKIAEAMQEAHQKGILHRDLKPANLLVSGDGRAFVSDFGLAWMDDRRGLSQSGEMVGTPFFMSPEQVAGGSMSTSKKNDIYSLGASLYQMLVLRRPFEASKAEQVFQAILHEEPIHPSRLAPRLPIDLVHICLKAMDRTPQRRYQSMQAFADDLNCFLRHEPVAAKAPSTLHRLRRWRERNPASFVAILLVAVMITILVRGGLLLQGRDLAKQRAETGWSDARFNRYDILMRAADEAIQGFRFGDARTLLELCESPLRDWSWRHANRRLSQHLRTLRPPGGPRLLTLDVHPEGKFVVGGFGDGSVTVWQTETGQVARELRPFSLGVYASTFSPDGHFLAAGGDTAEVRVYDTESWQQVASYQGHWAGVGGIVFAPDSSWLASCDDAGEIHFWQRSTQQIVRKIEIPPRAVFMALSSDGKQLAAADGERNVHVYSTETGSELMPVLKKHTELVYDLRFLQGDQILATASADENLYFWNLTLGGAYIGGGNAAQSALNSMAVMPQGQGYIVGDKDGMASVVKLNADGQLTLQNQWPAHFAFANAVRVSTAGSFIATGGDDGAVHLWNLQPERMRLFGKQAAAPAKLAAVAWNGEFVTCNQKYEVQFWDEQNGKLTTILPPLPSKPKMIALSPNAEYVASMDDSGLLRLTEVATGATRTLTLSEEKRASLIPKSKLQMLFSPDGKWLCLVIDQRRLFMVNMATQTLGSLTQEQHKVLLNQGSVLDFAWTSADVLWVLREEELDVLKFTSNSWQLLQRYAGNSAALPGRPKILALRPARAGSEVNDHPTGSVKDVAVVTTRGVAIFQMLGLVPPEKEDVVTLPVSTAGLTALAWHPNESSLAAGFQDGKIRIWNAKTGGVCTSFQGHAEALHLLKFSRAGDWLISAAVDGDLEFWGTQASPWPIR